VIVCLSDSSSQKLSYIAFSRAIFKTLKVVKPETEAEMNKYPLCLHLLPILRINQANPYQFRPILIDMIGFRQLAQMRTESDIVRHLKIDLDLVIKKMNFWILHLLENNNELSKVKTIL
jgi:hypothetical protein